MKVTYVNNNLETPEITLDNIARIEHEKVTRMDTEYDIISCVQYFDGNTTITELDLLGDVKIIIERG